MKYFNSQFHTKANTSNQGFTLIEVMVSLAIFTTVMTVAAGSLLSIIDANRKSQTIKSVVDNLNFALDDMARTIRVGSQFTCGPVSTDPNPSGPNCASVAVSQGATYNRAFSFRSQQGQLILYIFKKDADGIGRIYASYDSGVTLLPLTAPAANIDDMRFYVTGAEYGSVDGQPRVFITVIGHAGFGERAKYRSDFFLQTSITQRVSDQ